METTQKVKPIVVDYECDKCKTGKLRPGQMLMRDPPSWIHKCTECDYTKTFDLKYPYIAFMSGGSAIYIVS